MSSGQAGCAPAIDKALRDEYRSGQVAWSPVQRRTLRQTCDVLDRSSLEHLREAILSAFGKVDILVNCAGRTGRVPLAGGARGAEPIQLARPLDQ